MSSENLIKKPRNVNVVGNASGFEFDPEKSGFTSIPKPFDPKLYEMRSGIWHKKNAWLNLGTWLMGALLIRYPFLPDSRNQGLTYFALGHGNPAWGASPPGATATDKALYDEYYRQALNHSNFRVVNKELQTYVSHVGQTKIEIDGAISADDYGSYVGSTILVPTFAVGDYEERYIAGFETGGTNYWVYDSPLSAAPDGNDYYIFVPTAINETTIDTLKTSSYCYVEIEVIVSSEDANGDIREFGFFGGWASDTLDSGLIWNSLRHDLITKASLFWLVRRIRFDFY